VFTDMSRIEYFRNGGSLDEAVFIAAGGAVEQAVSLCDGACVKLFRINYLTFDASTQLTRVPRDVMLRYCSRGLY